MAFKHMLLKRAYTEKDMGTLANASNFRFFAIAGTPVGMEVTLVRREPLAEQAA